MVEKQRDADMQRIIDMQRAQAPVSQVDALANTLRLLQNERTPRPVTNLVQEQVIKKASKK